MSERVLLTLIVKVDDNGNHWAHIVPTDGHPDLMLGPTRTLAECMLRTAIGCTNVAMDARKEGL